MSHIPIDTQANNAVMVHAAIPDEHKINTAVAPMPREIIRWLQSLNLHKPLKHPKRDFQSGYVVAEIIQRAAFSDDLQAGGGELLSLVDNVSSAKRKQENWAALQLYLRRHNHPVFPDQLVADVMNAKDNAADEMLLMLYVKYGGRGFPGASAATRGGPPPAPQPLDRVPTFHKRTAEDIAAAAAAASSSSSSAAAAGKSTEAMKQLSAMAAEQLRAAELEMLKQQSDSNLRAEIMGLNGAAGAGAGEQPQQSAQSQQQQQQQQKPRHLPRAPAVPQPMVQGQIRAVDKSAESDDKAVLFDHRVSMRQLSGAALQRFGFRDRSQSPNGSARGLSPASAAAKGGAAGRIGALAAATTSGRGGVGAAVHGQLCLLIDRFVADFFAASTTWNPPADGSPLHYFIEQCSNPAVITPAFKATLWQFLLREAGTIAAVLACAPADTLYFVAHFANVSVEGRAPPPGDASFQNGDLWSPKFYGADALDSTLFCHAVLGALRTQKRAGADALLRRYALPALLPLLLDAGGNNNNRVSLRRAIFAVSSLALGSCDAPGSSSSAAGGASGGGSSLHFYVQPLSGSNATHVAGDLESGAALSPQEHSSRVQALQRMVLLLHDMLVADFDATVQYAAKLFAPDDLQARLYFAPAAAASSSTNNDADGGAAAPSSPANGKTGGSAPASRPSTGNAASKSRSNDAAAAVSAHKRVVLEAAPAASGSARQTVALLCCEAFVDALRGELPPQRLYARDAPVPPAVAETVALLAAPFLPRAVSSSPPSSAAQSTPTACAEAALKCLTALARSGAVATAAPEVVSLVVTQLQSVLSPMLAQTVSSGGNDGGGARSRVKVELFRLLCATLRCTWRGADDDADENGSNTTTAKLLSELFQRAGEDVARAVQAGSLSDAERLVLASAVASSLANFPLPQVTAPAGASSKTSSASSYAETFSGLAAFVVDSLIALPPSALEAFGLSGGNLGRALPSLFPAIGGTTAAANDGNAAAVINRAALSNPLDCGRWSITALARCISERFQAHNSQTNPHKIAAPGKTGSAGVLKLAAPPAGFAADPLAPDFAAFLRPYRSILLLFTLLLARQTDGAAASHNQAASSVMQPQRTNEEIAAWWHMLTGPAGASAAAAAADAQESSTRGVPAGATGATGTAPTATVTVTLGSELRKLLIYYDAARKGSAAVAPRTSNDAEAMHEIYVQAGRAALFIVVKLWSDLLGASAASPSTSQAGSMIPSHLQPSIAPALAALAARVSAPAAKASEDDAALGQQGLEIAVRAMEWFLGVLNGKQ